MALGVPQGSVLGPLLFIIFINGVSTVQLMPLTKIYLYADDSLLYKKIETIRKLKLTKIPVCLPSKQTSILYVNGLKITI